MSICRIRIVRRKLLIGEAKSLGRGGADHAEANWPSSKAVADKTTGGGLLCSRCCAITLLKLKKKTPEKFSLLGADASTLYGEPTNSGPSS